jgi:hypothetical protein
MNTTLSEPARTTPICGHCDVAVVGGGVAGVAAAVAAARLGAQVWLIEKEYALGGLATLGNVIIYLPLCDGHGRQVIGGLGEELLRLAVRDVRAPDRTLRVAPVPACWEPGGDPAERRRTRFRTDFNVASVILAYEELVTSAGIHLLYDSRLCGVVRDGRRITHLLLENKSGRSALAVGTVVDATGDADVCACAGEPTASLDTNVLAGWCYLLRDGTPELRPHSRAFAPDGSRTGAQGPFFRGDDAEQVTQQIVQTRAWLRESLAEWRAKAPASTLYPFQLATFPNLRMTRRLQGSVEIAETDMHHWFDDTVGLSGDWRKAGPVYALPLRCLQATRTANLLTAGRCLSASGSAWDALRAIPTCAVTGEAAGTAAALAMRVAGGDVGALPIADLQAQLQRQNVILDRTLVAPA